MSVSMTCGVWVAAAAMSVDEPLVDVKLRVITSSVSLPWNSFYSGLLSLWSAVLSFLSLHDNFRLFSVYNIF